MTQTQDSVYYLARGRSLAAVENYLARLKAYSEAFAAHVGRVFDWLPTTCGVRGNHVAEAHASPPDQAGAGDQAMMMRFYNVFGELVFEAPVHGGLPRAGDIIVHPPGYPRDFFRVINVRWVADDTNTFCPTIVVESA